MLLQTRIIVLALVQLFFRDMLCQTEDDIGGFCSGRSLATKSRSWARSRTRTRSQISVKLQYNTKHLLQLPALVFSYNLQMVKYINI